MGLLHAIAHVSRLRGGRQCGSSCPGATRCNWIEPAKATVKTYEWSASAVRSKLFLPKYHVAAMAAVAAPPTPPTRRHLGCAARRGRARGLPGQGARRAPGGAGGRGQGCCALHLRCASCACDRSGRTPLGTPLGRRPAATCPTCPALGSIMG